LFEIHKKNLELERSYTTLVDLYRIITSIKNKLQQRISGFDQVQTFINKQGYIAVTNECNEEKDDDDADHSANRIVRSDQFWMYIFSLTQSPNFKKLVCFLYALPYSNAYVESAFSQLKHLCNDQRNCMTAELISAELKIRLNSSLSCIEISSG
jgi:hypothetical protein